MSKPSWTRNAVSRSTAPGSTLPKLNAGNLLRALLITAIGSVTFPGLCSARGGFDPFQEALDWCNTQAEADAARCEEDLLDCFLDNPNIFRGSMFAMTKCTADVLGCDAKLEKKRVQCIQQALFDFEMGEFDFDEFEP